MQDREYARLIHGHSDELAEDAMIAATARVHGLTLATCNDRDFAHFSVAVFNPFKQASAWYPDAHSIITTAGVALRVLLPSEIEPPRA